MSDKLRTLETKRARQAKRYAPKFDVRALEAELRRENKHDICNGVRYRMDYGRMATNERSTQK